VFKRYGWMLVGLLAAACSSADQAAPPPSAAEELTLEPISYVNGFFSEESGASGTWRWMGPEGVIRLRNQGSDMVLTITTTVPAELTQGSTITYTLNGTVLETIPNLVGVVAKRYDVTAALQGTGDSSELRITAGTPFVPGKLFANGADTRTLGAAISAVTWAAK